MNESFSVEVLSRLFYTSSPLYFITFTSTPFDRRGYRWLIEQPAPASAQQQPKQIQYIHQRHGGQSPKDIFFLSSNSTNELIEGYLQSTTAGIIDSAEYLSSSSDSSNSHQNPSTRAVPLSRSTSSTSSSTDATATCAATSANKLVRLVHLCETSAACAAPLFQSKLAATSVAHH